ncbi:MAG: hypothetical protein ACHQ4J_10460 [Candidatus Binatia bacterium]
MFDEVTSYSSVMPPGGVKVVPVLTPKSPSNMSLAMLVLMEGAVTEVELAFACPLDASTGLAVLAPA